MKVAIIGFGNEGRSSAEYWSNKDNELTICDKNQAVNTDRYRGKLGTDYLDNLGSFDIVVRSPGVHPSDILKANGQPVLKKLTSNTNEFISVCPTRNIIGVTGTKGKGTTSSLITEMLRVSGHKVHIGGNIGLPPLELLKNNIQPTDWVVLELSNFQLTDLKSSPFIAVCLLIEPEHQDWHSSLDEYVQAKQQLFRWQTQEDIAIYFSENLLSKQVSSIGVGKKIPYYAKPGALVEDDKVTIGNTTICNIDDIKLLGKHNWQNVCAAVTTVWQVTQDSKGIRNAITSFAGLPFRLEIRGQHAGISYYNDSFSSQPESAIAAIKAIPTSKVIILGGYDRYLDLTKLAMTIKANETSIRKLIIIGAAAQRIADNLTKEKFDNFVIEASKDMSDIVASSRRFANEGDAIVLSPGFPSFDMFKNFEERGKQFNEAIPVK